MLVTKITEGKLKLDVSDTDMYIRADTNVVVEVVVDNFKNIFVRVVSLRGSVKLPYVETNISWLV
jgi:hypothetical protein